MKNFIATKFLSRNYLWIEIKNDRSLSKIIELINKISCIRKKGRIIEKTHIKYVFLIVYNLFFLKWLKFELNIYNKYIYNCSRIIISFEILIYCCIL